MMVVGLAMGLIGKTLGEDNTNGSSALPKLAEGVSHGDRFLLDFSPFHPLHLRASSFTRLIDDSDSSIAHCQR